MYYPSNSCYECNVRGQLTWKQQTESDWLKYWEQAKSQI